MKFLNWILIVVFTGFLLNVNYAQGSSQSIRGRVIDKDSQMPLFGASLIIADSDPQIGTITDENGEFNFGKLLEVTPKYLTQPF